MPALDWTVAWRKPMHAIRISARCFVISCLLAQGVISDTITYQQLRQDYGGRSPVQVSPVRQRQGQDPVSIVSQIPTQSGEENSGPAEFVRLRTGRIVDFSPGLLCDENCIEPISANAFGETGSVNLWWIVTPAIAGGVVCSFLCRSDRESTKRENKIQIPKVPDKHPTPSPPQEIPEPGTLLLLGLGLAAMIARKRHHRSKTSDD